MTIFFWVVFFLVALSLNDMCGLLYLTIFLGYFFFSVALALSDMSGLLYMTAIVVFFGWLVNCWERWSHNKNPLFFLQPCQATKKQILKSPLNVVCQLLGAVVTPQEPTDKFKKRCQAKKEISKVLYVVTLFRKYFRALTLENGCQDLLYRMCSLV
jgi:hypothetical protein